MTNLKQLSLVLLVYMLTDACLGLCNAPATFQRCMTAIFADFIEIIMEVFMDNFSVYGTSFTNCLNNLKKVFQCCEETNLVLIGRSVISWLKKV